MMAENDGPRPVLAIDCELDRGYTRLGSDRYTSETFMRREQVDLWPTCWQMVCREDEVAGAGSFQEYRLGERSYLVVRGDDGQVRAFHNGCLHRGNLLCTGEGQVGTLRCPYHAWTWRLDGRLARIPSRDLFDVLDDADYRLPEIGCDTWGGFVFVVPEPERAPTLLEYLDPLPSVLAPYRLDGYQPSGLNVELPVACNWKTFQDAFMETYHLPFLHSQMLHHANEERTRFALLGSHSLMVTPFGEASDRARGVSQSTVLDAYLRQLPVASRKLLQRSAGPGAVELGGGDGPVELPEGATAREVIARFLRTATELTGFDTSGFSDDEVTDVWQYSIFPNTLLSCHPGHVFVTRVLPHPTDPNRCTARIVNLQWSGVDGASPTPLRVLAEADIDAVALAALGTAVEQDLVNLPRQQQGLRTGSLQHQTLSRQEMRLAHLHRTIDDHLGRDDDLGR